MNIMNQKTDSELHSMRGLFSAEVERVRQRAAEIAGESSALLLAQAYADLGLEIVYADEAKTIPISLPMLLGMGWRIEIVDERPTLIRP
jgi:hypothetical protein